MVMLNFRTIAIPILLTAYHMVLHTLLNPYISSILNPILISIGIWYAYALLRGFFRRASKKRLPKNQLSKEERQDVLYPIIVAVLHFLAHLGGSLVTQLPIIDAPIVGFAGLVVLVSTAILEIFF